MRSMGSPTEKPPSARPSKGRAPSSSAWARRRSAKHAPCTMPKSACRGAAASASARLAQRVVRATASSTTGARRVAGRAHVELHLDVGAEQPLHADGVLRRQRVLRAVEVRLEREALLGAGDERAHSGGGRERERLEAARVGEHRVRPAREGVEASERGDRARRRAAASGGTCCRGRRARPVDATSPGVSVLTLPCVPTGMNVGRVDGAVRRLEHRAPRVAVAREDPEREARASAGSTASPEQHRVAVREEPVALGHGETVRVEHALRTGEGADEREQRRAGQVKVGEQAVDDAPRVAGLDEEPRLAGRRADVGRERPGRRRSRARGPSSCRRRRPGRRARARARRRRRPPATTTYALGVHRVVVEVLRPAPAGRSRGRRAG